MKIFNFYYLLLGVMCLAFLSSCDKTQMEPSALGESELSNISAKEIDNGLVYYFPFTGNSIDQVSNNAYDTHGAVFEDDRFGNKQSALCMTANYMNIDGGLGDPEGTLSFWINVRDFDGYDIGHGYLFGRYIGSIPVGTFKLGIHEEGYIWTFANYRWGADSIPLQTKPSLIKMKKWYHVLVRWSDTQEKIEIFLNNKKVLNANYIEGWEHTTPSEDEVARMGLESTYSGGHTWDDKYYHGRIDEIRRYNRWIDNNEVTILFKAKE